MASSALPETPVVTETETAEETVADEVLGGETVEDEGVEGETVDDEVVEEPEVELPPTKLEDIRAGFREEGEETGTFPSRERETPEQHLPNALVDYIVQHLGGEDLLTVRRLSERLLGVGSDAMRDYMQGRKELEAYTSTADTKMIDQYRESIKARSPKTLHVLADQIDPTVLDQLFSPLTSTSVKAHRAKERKAHGPSTPPTLPGHVDYSATHLPGPLDDPTGPKKDWDKDAPQGSKMHLKSMVGSSDDRPEFLLSGSPNLTQPGMTTNTESAVSIGLPGIAKMFEEYMGHVETRETETSDKGADFGQRVKTFNERNPMGIRAALAPFVNIGETLTTELKGADQIVMRMFLVSLATTGANNAPAQALIDIKKANPSAAIRVVVDKGQAESETYVQDALKALQAEGIVVEYETGPVSPTASPDDRPPIMHDKIVLAHYPENAKTGRENAGTEERWTVMLGSSGLTKNVVQNWNYENLLMIDDEQLFKDLLEHDAKTKANRTTGIPALVPRPKKKRTKKKPSAAVTTPVVVGGGGGGARAAAEAVVAVAVAAAAVVAAAAARAASSPGA